MSILIGFSRDAIPAVSASVFAPTMVLFWQRLHPITRGIFEA